MILAIVIGVISSLLFYVESFKSGLSAKKWALAGFFLGPMILPLFTISRRVALRQAIGFENSTFKA